MIRLLGGLAIFTALCYALLRRRTMQLLILSAMIIIMNGCRSREQICADLLPTYQPTNWAVVQVNGDWGTRFVGTGNLPLITK